MRMVKTFEALASEPRLKILAYLSKASLTAGEIAERFDMSKPSLSKHLSILENAGLITGVKKGKFVHYSIVSEHIFNSLDGYLQEVCSVRAPLRRESEDRARQAVDETGERSDG
ncbi:metalloregulator ArsR/SmtB family transcription factor [Asticcacaulis sp. BYS171W]|uniref:Metalloregulator ArsR/SmtB family transcription factor n=1 Tax=Asticcacaulis aquaticus TaxID=2984212 RepID=A0ABT5HY77_9CAUL|nr:metalloregulator ArsR/SmtB family transcription factor [Asticcacaulis aquaticus]MDC7684978.1 metalloregulator ArsR/SmtB family transcription factor [Asticcacaulis aquaticus]